MATRTKSLQRGTRQYSAACQLFGKSYVDRLIENAETKTSELEKMGIDHKSILPEDLRSSLLSLRRSIDRLLAQVSESQDEDVQEKTVSARFWNSQRTKATSNNGTTMASHYFGDPR